MPQLNVIVGLLNLHAGVLGIVISMPLLQRKVEMNRWFGIRIKKAFQSEENWYRINVYGAKWMIAVSSLFLAGGTLAFFIPSTVGAGLIHLTWLGPACLLFVALADILRFARKL